jgi:hypothetical protein
LTRGRVRRVLQRAGERSRNPADVPHGGGRGAPPLPEILSTMTDGPTTKPALHTPPGWRDVTREKSGVRLILPAPPPQPSPAGERDGVEERRNARERRARLSMSPGAICLSSAAAFAASSGLSPRT